MKKNSLQKLFKQFHSILPTEFRVKFYLVILSVFIISILDLFSIAAVIPLISVLTNPSILEKQHFINKIYLFFNFQTLYNFIIFISFVIFIMFIIKNIVTIYLLKFQSSFSYLLSNSISAKQYINYYRKGFDFISQNNSTVLARDIFNMPINFANGVTNSLITILTETTILTLITLGLFIYNPFLMIGLSAILIPTFLIAYHSIKKKLKAINLELLDIGPKISQNIFNSFLGYIDVKLFGKETFFFNKYTGLLNRFSKLNISKNVYMSITPKVFEIIIFFAVFLIILYGLLIIKQTSVVVEILGVFALSAYKLIPSLNKIFAALVSLKSYEYIFDYFIPLKEIENLSIEEKSKKTIVFKNEIKVTNLSFSYDKKKTILDNLNFVIKKGEYIGVIGKSGSGKTTLIKLLLRFLNESFGKISVDNVSLTTKNTSSWRKLIGYVPQQSYIVDGTLLDNIAFGVDLKDVDHNKIDSIISLCSLTELVTQSDKGVLQNIGEGGNKISGGQKQRIAIARALYRNVEILILDEATSSLDNETEREVMETINNLMVNNITVISIAHRYSSLKNCNKIIELKEGKINSIKTYKELIG